MKCLWMGLFFFLLACGSIKAEISWQIKDKQGFSASATFSHESISLLDKLRINLSLTYPKTYHPNLTDIRLHLFQHIGIGEVPFALDSEQISTPEIGKEGFLNQKISFVLVPQIPGTHALTFFEIPFDANDPKDGHRILLISGIATITVKVPSDIFDIKEYEPQLLTSSPALPIDLSPSNREQLFLNPERKEGEAKRNIELFRLKSIPWIGMIVLTAALLFAILSITRKAPASQRPYPIKMIDPKVKALKELDKIAHENLIVQGKSDELYLRLSKILNEFLEAYYHINTRTKSTEEVMRELSTLDLYQGDAIREFLIKAEQIKFGKSEISAEQGKNDILLLQNFIKKRISR